MASNRGAIWGGLIVALLGWGVAFQAPGPGIDPSWNAGLAMAVHRGLRFGSEVVFSYGPLGFLDSRIVFFGDLAVLSFLYAAVLYVLFCVALVWGLRRALPLVVALVVAFVAVAWLPMPLLEVALLSAVFACFWLLEGEHGARSLDLFALAAALFAAPAALGKLSTGPLVAVVFLLALLGARAGARRVAVYVVVFLAATLALWLATGQRLADVPAFLDHTIEIAGGYSAAMLRGADVAAWKVTAAVLAAIASGLALIAAAWLGGERRGRWARVAIVALVSFAIYKEGVVRVDAGHLTVLFANAAVLWIAVGVRGGHGPGAAGTRRRWGLAAAALVFAISLPVRPAGLATRFDPVANVRLAVDGARTLVSPARRADLTAAGRAGMRAAYALPLGALAALRGHTVAVEPWEAGTAWAYELDWRPLPVFQDYSAYTPQLDRLNATAVAAADGPERILRQNTQVVQPEFAGPDLDGRFPGWDPPAQARAVLCHFAPLYTDERWQVLGRVADRCGVERPLGAVGAAAGEAVAVPRPAPGEVVFVRIGGAGVSGLERLQTFLFHARSRHAILAGTTRYRLVPETAGDGLLLRAAPGLVAPGPFSPIPQARTIAVEGGASRLTYTFYAISLHPPRP